LWLRFGGPGAGPVPSALLELANALAGLPGALEEKAKEAQLPCPGNLVETVGFWLMSS